MSVAPWLVEFPATLRVTGVDGAERTVGNGKVFVWPDRCVVFVDGPGGPVAVLSGDVAGFEAGDPRMLPRDRVSTVRLVDGSSWRISRSGWCGCGSRLRGFSPVLPDVAPVAP